MHMILVTGGSRSGKSQFAEQTAMQYPGRVLSGKGFLYLATAKITDEDMRARVQKHQARRTDVWTTHEGYEELDQVLYEQADRYDGILLDSVSTMVTNLLFDCIGDVCWDDFDFGSVNYRAAEEMMTGVFDRVIQAAEKTDAPLVVVTDEIGLGVIPETPLGRGFRDILGTINQSLAAAADSVYFVVSGIPVKIK